MSYVTAKLRGGLGNRLFTLLAAHSYAQKTNRTCVLVPSLITRNTHESDEDTSVAIQTLFPTLKTIELDITTWKKLEDPLDGIHFYNRLPNHHNYSVVMDGYFQNPKYFEDLQKPQLPVCPRQPSTYFIHIRLTDFRSTIHELPLAIYYKRAIQRIQQADPNAYFLVFTDDKSQATTYIEQNINLQFEFRFSSAKTSFEVLKEMASCVGGITANSSLSWLGSYFLKPSNHIYMPSKWYSNTSDKHVGVYPSWATIISIV